MQPDDALVYLLMPNARGVKCNECQNCYYVSAWGEGNMRTRIHKAAIFAGWKVTGDRALCPEHNSSTETI